MHILVNNKTTAEGRQSRGATRLGGETQVPRTETGGVSPAVCVSCSIISFHVIHVQSVTMETDKGMEIHWCLLGIRGTNTVR